MKTLLTFLLAGWAGCALGQSAPTDSNKVDKADANSIVPQITPKSPTATALSRYGEFPVSLYTGLPQIEIPIHEFRVGNLVVPVKLTYHAGGNKVADQASWVGLGWSLRTGGMITRNVLGLPDEQPGSTVGGGTSILTRQLVVPSTATGSCLTGTAEEFMNAYAANRYDAQRDVFSYQLPSGERQPFMLFPSPLTAVLRSPEPTKVVATTTLDSFTVVDQSGVTYRFVDAETVGGTSFPACKSVWYLNEITGLDATDRAIYSYTTAGTYSSQDITDQITVTDLVYNRPPPNPGPGTISAGVSSPQSLDNPIGGGQLVPKQIHFPGGKIEFVLENRGATDESSGGRLKTIEVYGTSIGGSYTLIKKYTLLYTYKTRIGANDVLFLNQVVLTGTDNTTVGSYSMTYNTTPLPAASGRDKDYWGYYNGATGNNNQGRSLIPAIQIPYKDVTGGTQSTITIGGSYREPSPSVMKAWVLEQLVYPTGGYSEFELEPNQYFGDSVQTAGGLRIRRIRNFTGLGALASQKTYRYGTGENGAGKMRFGKTFPNSSKPAFVPVERNIEYWDGGTAPGYTYRMRVYTSSPAYPLTSEEGSPVTYSVVAEYEDNGLGAIGKTVYEYRDDALDETVLINGKSYVKSRSWNRGQLLSQKMYDSQGRIRWAQMHSYSTLTASNAQTSQLAGMLISFSREASSQVGTSPPTGSGCALYNFPVSYQWEFGLVRRSATMTYVYDDLIPNRYTLKTTQTDYSTRHYQPIETRTLVEGTAILGTRYSYPQDFTATIPTTGEAELQGIKLMQDRNVYRSVETINFRRNSPTAERVYTTGQLTTYTPHILNNRATPLPYQVFLPETDFNAKVYTPTDLTYTPSSESFNRNPTANAFPVHLLWKPRLTMNSYDTQGNLTSMSVTAGASTTYAYVSVTPVGGVPFSYLTSETQNATQANAQTTTYAYLVPLLGVTTVTEPRGVYATYEYDTFGRLARVKDQQGNILKQYSYRYATQ